MVCLLILNLPWLLRPVARTESEWRDDVLSGRDFHGAPVERVAYTAGEKEKASRRFGLRGSFLYLPFQGAGAELEADVFDASGYRVATLRRRADGNPELAFWKVDIRGWRGFAAAVRARPASVWCGNPILSDQSVDTLPARPMPACLQTNYAYYFLCALAIAVMLFAPGWVIRVRKAAWIPMPGLGLMAGTGLVAYALGPSHGWLAGKGLLLVDTLVLALAVIWPPAFRSQSQRGPQFAAGAWLGLAAVAAAAVLDSAMRSPMGEDFWSGSPQQGRLAASPPDSTIPYRTAAYLRLSVHSPAISERFFWKGWSAVSRGPLMPLVILGEFGLAPPQVQVGGDASDGPWPAAVDSFYLARFIGILTNACVILAGAELLAVWGADPTRARWALAWLALAPVTWINVTFVWPKLLATYFLLMACAAVFAPPPATRSWRQPLLRGTLVALAYYAHPVGALFAPAVFLLCFRRNGLGAALAATIAGLVICAPWFWIKHRFHQPDPFLAYALGDGHGTLPAVSVGSWLGARCKSLVNTLVPGAWLADAASHIWRGRRLNRLLLWSVQYSKTLPTALGYACAWIPPIVARRRSPSPEGFRRDFANWFLLPGFVLALAFWGYSTDGLGRNCLEPLSVGVILWAGAQWPLGPKGTKFVLLLLAFETLLSHGIGLAGAAGFTLGRLSIMDFALLLASAVIFTLPATTL